jgi:hypothetical protein
MSLVSALALLAVETPGPTGRWWFLFADDRSAWFADGLTATRNGEVADLSYERVHRAAMGRVMRARIRTLIDCAQPRWKNVVVDVFDSRGRPLASAQPANPEWRYFLPGGHTATLQRYACKKVGDWESVGATAVFREPRRVATDFYGLLRLGLQKQDAISLARYDRTRQMAEIRDFIDQRTLGDLRVKLLRLYGLPAEPTT